MGTCGVWVQVPGNRIILSVIRNYIYMHFTLLIRRPRCQRVKREYIYLVMKEVERHRETLFIFLPIICSLTLGNSAQIWLLALKFKQIVFKFRTSSSVIAEVFQVESGNELLASNENLSADFKRQIHAALAMALRRKAAIGNKESTHECLSQVPFV